MLKNKLNFLILFMLFLFIIGSFVPTSITESNKTTSVNAASTANIYLPIINRPLPPEASWSMVAGNPQRTSYLDEEVSGYDLDVEWYRPIEAYIPQNVQIIASNGLLYISTSDGLYALNAANGSVAWRFDTEMPLGHSPTVANNVVYVGGYDRKLHALDASSGTYLWSFDEALAGYDTNPLVVDGKVILGNQDGYMYAIGAHNTSEAGQLIWKFKAGGPIRLSAAYNNGVVYFAANDNYGYALNVHTGQLIWKSSRLPGEQYQSYWPVIYQDKVIFSGTPGYRYDLDPGTRSVLDDNGNFYAQSYYMDRDAIFGDSSNGTTLGSQVYANHSWAQNNSVIDVSEITEYFEEKPWRRVVAMLNQANGSEFTFDSDNDGRQEYFPVTMWGTQSGNRYPPIVGADNILYVHNIYQKNWIAQGQMMGWNPDYPSLFSVIGGGGAVDEPQATSMGGNLIYRNICCDRVGSYIDSSGGSTSSSLWTYSRPLSQLAPGYDSMWTVLPEQERLRGWYGNSINGVYHNHGDQNPIIPHQERLYVHRSNAIIAYGSGNGPGKLPLLTKASPSMSGDSLTENELKALLEEEIQKMIDAGKLRPGYYNAGQFQRWELADYFINPGDTLYTLTKAYPYLSPELQAEARPYLQMIFSSYFDSDMYGRIGWADGQPRESIDLPPEVESSLADYVDRRGAGNEWAWNYPQYNFYGMWKYAEIFPGEAVNVYNLAKSELEVPVTKDSSYFEQKPWHLNGYIAGYIGFLELQEVANKSSQDAQLRSTVQNELDRLLSMRVNSFSKDTPWQDSGAGFDSRPLNVSRNFIMLVPELGDYLNQNHLATIQDAVDEYEYVAPYWFASRFNASQTESAMAPLYDTNALFMAKAYILGESRSELSKYISSPGFMVGDLFYIQNVTAALEAQ